MQSFRGDDMAGFLAEAVCAVADTLQRAIHFEELVGFVSEQGPQGVAVFVFLGGLGHVAAKHLGRGDRLRDVLGVNSQQPLAQTKQRAIMPGPLRRDALGAGRIRRVNFLLVPFRRGRCRRSGWGGGSDTTARFHGINL